ncbi:ribosomal protein L7/L12 [Herbinix luporum]|jgi:elongation factor Tu|uniref:50S ribosomal protein L7/L12 n=2 Tax=Herbinix luporum TaxID=1679721 RepID=A0A0K8J7A4_9FIRM|nr:ribosomal protein L7/L12 [Herbinix luporum]MDI9488125.1 ribosomal protein L7/L12 [Bacillota bacterium]CUH93435.1 hypothetical protein SD1D_1895 [Herbinix luporum]HHT56829.1 hypothetical protein [Herbinix luporum]
MKERKIYILFSFIMLLMLTGCNKKNNLISKDFLMQIEETYSISGKGAVATGKILSGYISTNAVVDIVGLRDEAKSAKVGSIRISDKRKDTAKAGDTVSILLNNIEESDVERGQVLAAKGTISAHNTFYADLTFTANDSEDFFKNGKLDALCYFFTTDSTAILYYNYDDIDENGCVPVQAKMVAKLPMKVGTPFMVQVDGEEIAMGKVTAVDVDIDIDTVLEWNLENVNEEDSDEEGPFSFIGKGNVNITLVEVGDRKVNLIKDIREITGLEIKEAKKLVDEAPSLIIENITKEEAALIKEQLESQGATVEITNYDG